MSLHVSSFKIPMTMATRTFVRRISGQSIGAPTHFLPWLTTLGVRGPSIMNLEKVPLDVTRLEIINELTAAGPIGRVLTLHIATPRTDTRQAVRQNQTRVVIQYDTKGEVDRLATLIREGAFTVRGTKPVYFFSSPKAGLSPWLATTTKPGNAPDYSLLGSQLPSRVLRIIGPASHPIMTEASLRHFFEQRRINVETELVGVRDYQKQVNSIQPRIIEWRFCDWTNQAWPAYLALKQVAGIFATYGIDPCERGYSLHELSSSSSSKRPSTGLKARAAQPNDQAQHTDQDMLRNEQHMRKNGFRAGGAEDRVLERRTDFANPEFDSWARAWGNERQAESQGDPDQERHQVLEETPQTIQVTPPDLVTPSTPAPSSQDPLPGSPTQVP